MAVSLKWKNQHDFELLETTMSSLVTRYLCKSAHWQRPGLAWHFDPQTDSINFRINNHWHPNNFCVQRVKDIQVLIGMGCLLSWNDSGSTFTARQWMSWTLFPPSRSVVARFGLACGRLFQRSITMQSRWPVYSHWNSYVQLYKSATNYDIRVVGLEYC